MQKPQHLLLTGSLTGFLSVLFSLGTLALGMVLPTAGLGLLHQLVAETTPSQARPPPI